MCIRDRRSIERSAAVFGGQVARVFLGDGDALALSTRRLMTVLDAIRTHLPRVRRVSSYCLPRNVRHKKMCIRDRPRPCASCANSCPTGWLPWLGWFDFDK